MKLLEKKGFMFQVCPESTSKCVQSHIGFTMQNQGPSLDTVNTNAKSNCLQETMVIVRFLGFLNIEHEMSL